MAALAKVEEAYKHETETKEAIEQVIESCSLYNLLDTLGAAEDETSENRSLPAMNKIWPFLITCFRNKNLVVSRSIIKSCSSAFLFQNITRGNNYVCILHHRPSEDAATRLPPLSKSAVENSLLVASNLTAPTSGNFSARRHFKRSLVSRKSEPLFYSLIEETHSHLPKIHLLRYQSSKSR